MFEFSVRLLSAFVGAFAGMAALLVALGEDPAVIAEAFAAVFVIGVFVAIVLALTDGTG